MLDMKTTRVTREASVDDTRTRVIAQAAYCDEQTLAAMYAAAYEHVLDCRYDLSRDAILFDMYEHRPLTIEEIDAKRAAEAKAKEAERSKIAEEWMARARQLVDDAKQTPAYKAVRDAVRDFGANVMERLKARMGS